jgi:ABC transporter C-terminal domain
VVEVDGGRLTAYPGNWEYYQWKKGRSGVPRSTSPSPAPAMAPASSSSEASPTDRDDHPAAAAEPARARRPYRERKEVQRRHRQVERRILDLEQREEELARVLSDPMHASDYELLVEASAEADAVREELSSLYPEWEELADTVASLDD